MMRPQLRAFIAGSASRVVWKAELRLMAMIASHFSGGKSSTLRHVLDAGVVDQDVDRTDRAHGVGHHVLDLGGLAHVGAVVADLAAEGGDLALGRVDVAEAIEHDVGALAGQHLGDAQADAAGRAGDEGGLSLQHE